MVGNKTSYHFFLLLIFIFLLKIVFFIKYADIYYKKDNMKNIILFILIILCIAQFFLIKAQQHKITDLERTIWVKEQVILNDRR